MFNATFKYAIEPSTSTITVGITPKSLLKITLQSTFWAVAPAALFIGGCWIADALDKPKPRNTEVHETETN